MKKITQTTIAHIAIATPHRSGLYETTRELVAAERALGADARIVDPKPVKGLYPGKSDRGTPLADIYWAKDADLIVSHSGHDGTAVEKTKQPIIHVNHGRPYSTFLLEHEGSTPGYSYAVQRDKNPRYKAVVTFWPEHEPFLRALWRTTPVHSITPPVDTKAWKPGKSTYDFSGKAGDYNVVMADPWSRKDATPYFPIHAYAIFARVVPGARLHIYAVGENRKGYLALLSTMNGQLGELRGWTKDLLPVYRKADMLISSNKVYTRSIREAMSTGVQVVSGKDCDPQDIHGFAKAMAWRMEHPVSARKLARALFDPKDSAQQFLDICMGVLDGN